MKLYKANDGVHKYIAVFDNPYQEVPFGASGYSDYTQNQDPERKRLYLIRHRKREDWNNPRSAGALSRWLLWNKLTLEESFKDYTRRFQ